MNQDTKLTREERLYWFKHALYCYLKGTRDQFLLPTTSDSVEIGKNHVLVAGQYIIAIKLERNGEPAYVVRRVSPKTCQTRAKSE